MESTSISFKYFNEISPEMDLLTASSIGDPSLVHKLIQQGANVDQPNESGWTPLMYAAHYGHYNVVKMLIDYGANVNLCESVKGRTPLMLAASCGHTRCLEVLITLGAADIEMTDSQGHNAAYYAIHSGHGRNKIIAKLLKIQGKSRSSATPTNLPSPNCLSASHSNRQIRHQQQHQQQQQQQTSSLTPSSSFTPTVNHHYHHHHHAKSSLTPSPSPSPSSFSSSTTTTSTATSTTTTLPPANFSNKKSSPGVIGSQLKVPSPWTYDRSTASPKYNDTRISCSGTTGSSPLAGNSSNSSGDESSLPTIMSDSASTCSIISSTSSISDGGINRSRSPLPENLDTLLERIGLSQYSLLFTLHGIDLYCFLTLNESDFEEIGITLLGHKRKLYMAQLRFRESVEIASTQERFFADWLLSERENLKKENHELKSKLKGNDSISPLTSIYN
ncbi:ankyrin repeat and SAM domain-containing protein 3-like [Panonychus citri]|uniref:ankyrin repeat and SAM domain-containing protein 3-like n=1 Tax=Panonychus citri TaxID=50023 RepID=UPI0023070113|nr:ankyrin repeat and SAM domain-containing protein 3-like [Panonychus citri]